MVTRASACARTTSVSIVGPVSNIGVWQFTRRTSSRMTLSQNGARGLEMSSALGMPSRASGSEPI